MKKHLLIAAAFAGVLSFSSCYTDPDPGTGIVIAKDFNDFRIPGAQVTLHQQGDGHGTLISSGYTGVNGEYSYTHRDPQTGLALEVILDIDVFYGSRHGQGIIRITPGETTTAVVHL